MVKQKTKVLVMSTSFIPTISMPIGKFLVRYRHIQILRVSPISETNIDEVYDITFIALMILKLFPKPSRNDRTDQES